MIKLFRWNKFDFNKNNWLELKIGSFFLGGVKDFILIIIFEYYSKNNLILYRDNINIL